MAELTWWHRRLPKRLSANAKTRLWRQLIDLTPRAPNDLAVRVRRVMVGDDSSAAEIGLRLLRGQQTVSKEGSGRDLAAAWLDLATLGDDSLRARQAEAATVLLALLLGDVDEVRDRRRVVRVPAGPGERAAAGRRLVIADRLSWPACKPQRMALTDGKDKAQIDWSVNVAKGTATYGASDVVATDPAKVKATIAETAGDDAVKAIESAFPGGVSGLIDALSAAGALCASASTSTMSRSPGTASRTRSSAATRRGACPSEWVRRFGRIGAGAATGSAARWR